jgi:hypothetical protein
MNKTGVLSAKISVFIFFNTYKIVKKFGSLLVNNISSATPSSSDPPELLDKTHVRYFRARMTFHACEM